MWPEPAGEFGALELGELLWEELPPANTEETQTHQGFEILILKNRNEEQIINMIMDEDRSSVLESDT